VACIQIDVWGETTAGSNTSTSAVDLHVMPQVYDEVTARLRRSNVQFDVTINDLQRQAAIYYASTSVINDGRCLSVCLYLSVAYLDQPNWQRKGPCGKPKIGRM